MLYLNQITGGDRGGNRYRAVSKQVETLGLRDSSRASEIGRAGPVDWSIDPNEVDHFADSAPSLLPF